MKNDQMLKIRTAEGLLRGNLEQGVFVFRGIPYAAPPTGHLRWRAPKPVQPWEGERDATLWGNASWQSREYCMAVGGGDPGVFSEDCLYLNVWTPEVDPSRPLPVMVWIHGGGFAIGAGGLAPYVGLPLASRGVVIVTLNYRLGHMGFFAHPALDKEYQDGEVVNNFALLDQMAALQWVQRNISSFGGDSRNVTIFGESSGARSVLSLFASPLSAGLFHKGIAQSAYTLPDIPRETALETGTKLAKHFNLENATAEQLRALPADAFWPLDRSLANGPVAISGDHVLPEPMLSVFNHVRQHKLPLMIGSNSDEASVLSYFGVDPAKVIEQVRQTQHIGLRLKLIRMLYDGVWDDSELGRQVARDMTFTTMGYVAALSQHRNGVPAWRYYFDYVSENARDLYPNGTWHGNEIPYTLNTLDALATQMADRPFTENDRAFAHKVSEYWLNFARDASVFSHQLKGEIVWPAWQPYADNVMRFGEKGEAALKLEKRFMRRRTQLFRLLMKKMVRLRK
ncbi:carboxylesterase/lipase family protein [Pantoea sp. BAV 3049]|uniref:carboxylesterase/lipase family protein n=1 Tax=Pantoea sp. BAV 3049 TaxID=2654188 RepID=UPI00131D5DD0|nr:carboxylesterase/lipase family protein [Pantoea sp. BAV 3049]